MRGLQPWEPIGKALLSPQATTLPFARTSPTEFVLSEDGGVSFTELSKDIPEWYGGSAALGMSADLKTVVIGGGGYGSKVFLGTR